MITTVTQNNAYYPRIKTIIQCLVVVIMKESTPRCEDVADKLVRLFGWRQTYPVQKLQRSILPQTNDTVRFGYK